MKQLCTFFIATTLFIAKTNHCTAQVNVNDSLALVDLYNSTNGANWNNNLGWLQGPISNWKGVFTSNGRVIEINLQNNNLTGKLPTSIGKLTQLGSLNLESNQISDTIPNSIGNLLNLIFLDLGINNLSGVIPSAIGKLVNLQTLNFAYNQFFCLSFTKMRKKIKIINAGFIKFRTAEFIFFRKRFRRCWSPDQQYLLLITHESA